MDETEKKDLEILWTPKQVADYFTLSIRTVYQWISSGKVIDPAKIVRVGNRVRIPRSEVERIAKSKKAVVAATPIKN